MAETSNHVTPEALDEAIRCIGLKMEVRKGRPWTSNMVMWAEIGEIQTLLDWIAERRAVETKASPQAPIARIVVHPADDSGPENAELLEMYAPGLPPGEHDLYCEPEAMAPYVRASETAAEHPTAKYLRQLASETKDMVGFTPTALRNLADSIERSAKKAGETFEPRHTLDCDTVKHPNCTHCNCGSSIDPHYLERAFQSPQASVRTLAAPTDVSAAPRLDEFLVCDKFEVDPRSAFCNKCGYPRRDHRTAEKAAADPYKATCQGGTGGPCTAEDCEICWPDEAGESL